MGPAQLRKFEQSFCCAVVWCVYCAMLLRVAPAPQPGLATGLCFDLPEPFHVGSDVYFMFIWCAFMWGHGV
jgi:hypothetical protein